jgi:uncharacterized protein
VKIDLRELQDGANEFHWEEGPEELHIEDSDLGLSGPIRTRATVYKLGESLSANGRTSFHLRTECVRCLEPFEAALSCEFKLVLQEGRPSSVEGDEDDGIIWLDAEHGKVDLGKEVKDYVLLEIPMDPVCSESCAGLCPHCGENLNIQSCSCSGETKDQRWEALKALKDE